jgi:hypothetical protein
MPAHSQRESLGAFAIEALEHLLIADEAGSKKRVPAKYVLQTKAQPIHRWRGLGLEWRCIAKLLSGMGINVVDASLARAARRMGVERTTKCAEPFINGKDIGLLLAPEIVKALGNGSSCAQIARDCSRHGWSVNPARIAKIAKEHGASPKAGRGSSCDKGAPGFRSAKALLAPMLPTVWKARKRLRLSWDEIALLLEQAGFHVSKETLRKYSTEHRGARNG